MTLVIIHRSFGQYPLIKQTAQITTTHDVLLSMDGESRINQITTVMHIDIVTYAGDGCSLVDKEPFSFTVLRSRNTTMDINLGKS